MLLNGRYRVDENRSSGLLGQGGAATVWRGEDTHLRQPVAVKLFTVNGTLTSEQDERFRAEARAAATLRHPNIVTVTDYNVDAGRPYLVMELMEGGSLAQWLHRDPRAVRLASLRLGVALAEALAAAHTARQLHLDVKPANVLFGRISGAESVPGDPLRVLLPKLSDFGAGRMLNVAGVSHQSTPLGTAAYAAPEQVRGQSLDQRTDIYALGIVIYQMLSGALPFPGETPQLQLRQRLEQPPIALHEQRPELPIDLCEVVERAIERMPARRWENAQALAEALRPFLRRSDGPTAPTDRQGVRQGSVRRSTTTAPRPTRTTYAAPPAPSAPTAPLGNPVAHRPHKLADLERDIVIVPGVAGGPVYGYQGVYLHAQSVVHGTVFARGPVVIEAGCEIFGDVISLTRIEMAGGAARSLCAPMITLTGAVALEGALLCHQLCAAPGVAHLPGGSAIEGPVLLDPAYALPLEGVRGRPLGRGTIPSASPDDSQGDEPLVVGSGCELSGIFGQTSVVIPPRVRRLDTVRVRGHVEVEGESWVQTVVAEGQVHVGTGATVSYLATREGARVAPGGTVMRLVSGGRVEIAPGARVGHRTIVSPGGTLQIEAGATWANGSPLLPEQRFGWTPEDGPPGMVATTLLTHDLWQAYVSLDAHWFPGLTLPPA